jgi:hypothetical protein
MMMLEGWGRKGEGDEGSVVVLCFLLLSAKWRGGGGGLPIHDAAFMDLSLIYFSAEK